MDFRHAGRAIALASGLMLETIVPSGATARDVATRRIVVDVHGETRSRNRMAQMSIGADYPGTLIRDDSIAQLHTVQKELRFRYIRFHNIFADQLGVYREVNGKAVHDWRRVDRLYDQLLGMGLKPFVELGFTPDAMKQSNQTIFYWKGNTSHPQPAKWTALVDAFVRHAVSRYGKKEVRSWYFEFWNEPNLDGFWEKADQKAYFDYYARTARAVKAVDPLLRIGGPSTAGAAWIPEFLANANTNGVPVDFVTTHTYGVEGGFLDEKGEGDNKLSRNPDAVVQDVRKVRKEMDAAGRSSLPLFFTEWSTSYNPRDPIHDDYLSAAYILSKLRRTEGLAQGMSYWTYSDLFEEPGPQTRPFEGGFGLMTPQGVRKASWFAYKYLADLGDRELPTRDDQSIATLKDGTVQVLAWTAVLPKQPVSNRPFFTKLREPAPSTPLTLELTGLKPGSYQLRTRRTGFQQNDAYSTYLKMGRPAKLTGTQLQELQDVTADTPLVSTVHVQAGKPYRLTLPMREQDVVMVELRHE
ncbi:cellulase family glycosylhydrolase [Sphingomonas sp. PB2P12]|uniref:GH39 family glycosyl hydrolase n=1 Tax=Sphingomonas sandaracina TaxID=3096157 RepID=UPI002FC9E30A